MNRDGILMFLALAALLAGLAVAPDDPAVSAEIARRASAPTLAQGARP
jgi:hypothetical protein